MSYYQARPNFSLSFGCLTLSSVRISETAVMVEKQRTQVQPPYKSTHTTLSSLPWSSLTFEVKLSTQSYLCAFIQSELISLAFRLQVSSFNFSIHRPSTSPSQPTRIRCVLVRSQPTRSSSQFGIHQVRPETQHFDSIVGTPHCSAAYPGDHRRKASGTPRTLDPHRQSGTHRQRSCRHWSQGWSH
jgi:hypothetical protein